MTWAEITQSINRTDPAEQLVLRNLRVPTGVLTCEAGTEAHDGLTLVDLTIAQGKLADIRPAKAGAQGGIDLQHRMLWPAAINCHSHIDKGQVWPRSPNFDGSFAGALSVSGADFAAYQTDDDLRTRANFSLACAFAHGTALLRTHVDVTPETLDRRFALLREVAQDWAGRIDVQLCPFAGITDDPDWLARIAIAAKATTTRTLSFFLQAGPHLAADLDRVVKCALDHDLGLDFHADENLDPASDCLDAVARALDRHRFERPVLVGHCCALSVQDNATVARTLDRVAKTPIGIVALPLCNMYLQERRTQASPRQRGIAPLKEIRARGIPVAIGSDNARDGFYAYGDLDMPDLFRDAVRMMQLDHPVGDWPATVLKDAAGLIGAPDKGVLAAGMPADLILFPARNWSEFIARPSHDRIVLRAGQSINTTPPDFADLDSLEGMTP